ncbi:hypothetical protein R6Q57_001344 [Mikania cordata]
MDHLKIEEHLFALGEPKEIIQDLNGGKGRKSRGFQLVIGLLCWRLLLRWGRCNRLVSTIGMPKLMDRVTRERCTHGRGKLGFARILVQVSAANKLPECVEVEYPSSDLEAAKVVKLEVTYQWKPPMCTKCKGMLVALGRLAVTEKVHLTVFRFSCLAALENKRFDKVKVVRESMNQTLELWKEIPEHPDEVPVSPRFNDKSSSKGYCIQLLCVASVEHFRVKSDFKEPV